MEKENFKVKSTITVVVILALLGFVIISVCITLMNEEKNIVKQTEQLNNAMLDQDVQNELYLEAVKKIDISNNVGDTTYFLTSTGKLYGAGRNSYYKLGDTIEEDKQTEKYIKIADDVKAFSATTTYTFILKNNGNLYISGFNKNDNYRLDKTRLLMTNVKEVTASEEIATIITEDNTLYVMGENLKYLGIESSNRPVKYAEDVKSVKANAYNLAMLTTDNTLYMLGLDKQDVLDNSSELVTNENRVKILENVKDYSFTTDIANFFDIYAINDNNELYAYGTITKNNLIKLTDGAVSVKCGRKYAAVLKEDKTLHVIGSNNNGRIGLGRLVSFAEALTKLADNVKEVEVGDKYMFYITSEGELFATGTNISYELGTETTDNVYLPKKILKNVEKVVTNNPFSTDESLDRTTIVCTKDNDIYAAGKTISGEFKEGEYFKEFTNLIK